MNELVVKNLRKQYKKRTVVQDISLSIKSGEIVGLLGPNGAGKTTSFYMIVGLVPLDSGQIILNGKDVSRMPIHQRAHMGISYLPQEASIFRKLTAVDNIRAILELQNLSENEVKTRLEELLEELHITHIKDTLAVSLSGGERRRVEIARCLASNPSFILLDEPFAGIDPIAVLDIQKTIKFLAEKGIGILITDHNVRETLGTCDHAYIVNEGHIFASRSPAEIVENDDVRKVYLGKNFKL